MNSKTLNRIKSASRLFTVPTSQVMDLIRIVQLLPLCTPEIKNKLGMFISGDEPPENVMTNGGYRRLRV